MYVMVQVNMDLGVLFKINITGGVSSDYNMLVSEAPSKHQGG